MVQSNISGPSKTLIIDSGNDSSPGLRATGAELSPMAFSGASLGSIDASYLNKVRELQQRSAANPLSGTDRATIANSTVSVSQQDGTFTETSGSGAYAGKDADGNRYILAAGHTFKSKDGGKVYVTTADGSKSLGELVDVPGTNPDYDMRLIRISPNSRYSTPLGPPVRPPFLIASAGGSALGYPTQSSINARSILGSEPAPSIVPPDQQMPAGQKPVILAGISSLNGSSGSVSNSKESVPADKRGLNYHLQDSGVVFVNPIVSNLQPGADIGRIRAEVQHAVLADTTASLVTTPLGPTQESDRLLVNSRSQSSGAVVLNATVVSGNSGGPLYTRDETGKLVLLGLITQDLSTGNDQAERSARVLRPEQAMYEFLKRKITA